MTNHRLKLWDNILKDLGPGGNCVLPWWLAACYCILFPLEGLRWFLVHRADPQDLFRMAWTIHGVEYSDAFFRQLALADGRYWFNPKRVGDRVIFAWELRDD